MNAYFRLLVLLIGVAVVAYVAVTMWLRPSRRHLVGNESLVSAPAAEPKATHQKPQARAQRSEPRATPSPIARVVRREAPVTTTTTEVLPRVLLAHLLPPQQASSTPLTYEARIGVAWLHEADLAEARLAQEYGATHVPAAESDLINVRQWLPANVSYEPGGRARVGPVEVPPADAYEVLAWNHDARVYYHSRVVLSSDDSTSSSLLDAGLLAPKPFTGIRFLISGEADFPSIRVLAERIPQPDPEPASAFLRLARIMAPELTSSVYEGEPLSITLDQPTVLAPLAADAALRLTFLSPSDVESTPVVVELREGTIVNLALSLDEMFPTGAEASIALRGRLVAADTDEPIANAIVRQPRSSGFDEFVTDETGIFELDALPMNKIVMFELVTKEVPSTRPRFPSPWRFEFVPPLVTTGTLVSQTWRVPTLGWLVLDLTPWSPEGLRKLTFAPYPVYFIESRDTKLGNWRPARSQHFLEGKHEVAIAIEEPGQYRVGLALAPSAVWFTSPVRTTSSSEQHVTLSDQFPRTREATVRVVHAVTREPIARAAVTIAGPHPSLPPLRLITNENGVVRVPVGDTGEIAILAGYRGFFEQEQTLRLETNTEPEITIELQPQTKP